MRRARRDARRAATKKSGGMRGVSAQRSLNEQSARTRASVSLSWRALACSAARSAENLAAKYQTWRHQQRRNVGK